MAVMSPTNAKVHFKAYDGQIVDALGNSVISTSNVTMTSAQAELGQESAYIPDNGRVTFSNTNLFNVGAGDFTMGFWWRPDDWAATDGWKRVFSTNGDNTGYVGPFVIDFNTATGRLHFKVESAVDWVGSEIGQPEYLEELFNYQLPAGANTWYHIMVTRDNARQETTLFVNGGNTAGSIQYGFELSTSNNPTLGAEPGYSNAASGYFQDFFWMNEALDRTINSQHFVPGFTENSLAFTNSAPSISSFSSSAASATNGSSVTLSWSVSGETNLQLLKYVGGLLSSTEDVLGLSSKQVTITETVSYKLRATNTEGSVDSASVQIQLSQGGNIMPQVTGASAAGLVLQKDMLDASTEIAAVLQVSHDGGDKSANAAIAALEAADAAEEARALAAEAAIQADVDQNELDGDNDRALIRSEFAAADAAIQAELDDTQAGAGLAVDGSYVANVAANYISTAASLFEADEKLDVEVKSNADAIVAEAAARAAADTALQSELDATQTGAGLSAAGAYVATAGANFIAAATSLDSADVLLDAALKAEETARIAADAAISAEVAKTSFTHTGNKEGKLVLEDTTTGFTQVTMDFALVNGTVQLTLS